MTRSNLVVAFLLAAATAVAGSAMAATTTEVVKVNDQSLLASFDQQINVCSFGINSAVDVQWNSSILRADGITRQSAIIVNVHYVNSCTGDDLTMSGFSLTPNGTVNGDLSRGHADAVVPVSTDPELGNVRTATVTLSLNWVGSGTITKISDRSKVGDGSVTFINNFFVNSRPGVATGTATATMPLNDPKHPGTIKPTFVNLIGTPSLAGSLGRDGFGTITIVRKTK
ncbi:MAG TPA: hypothetical protein VNO55_02630 [Polyangia bacterium]|nr:hypothetical protein [Polyangia bacterium]